MEQSASRCSKLS